jgi:hypothetical protein
MRLRAATAITFFVTTRIKVEIAFTAADLLRPSQIFAIFLQNFD